MDGCLGVYLIWSVCKSTLVCIPLLSGHSVIVIYLHHSYYQFELQKLGKLVKSHQTSSLSIILISVCTALISGDGHSSDLTSSSDWDKYHGPICSRMVDVKPDGCVGGWVRDIAYERHFWIQVR